MAVERELGAVIKRYETDTGRRKRIFLITVPLGVVVAGVGVLMLIGGPAGSRFVPSLVTGLGLGSVIAGVWQGCLAVSRPGEAFTLYEGGLVHAYAGKSWAIAWDDIAKVTDRGRDNALNRAIGGDVNYHIRLASPIGGRKTVVITGLTDDAVWLGETIQQAFENHTHPKHFD